MKNQRDNELEQQLAADRAREEQQRQERDARAAQALADAQKALDQSGVSLPPGARGH